MWHEIKRESRESGGQHSSEGRGWQKACCQANVARSTREEGKMGLVVISLDQRNGGSLELS